MLRHKVGTGRVCAQADRSFKLVCTTLGYRSVRPLEGGMVRLVAPPSTFDSSLHGPHQAVAKSTSTGSWLSCSITNWPSSTAWGTSLFTQCCSLTWSIASNSSSSTWGDFARMPQPSRACTGARPRRDLPDWQCVLDRSSSCGPLEGRCSVAPCGRATRHAPQLIRAAIMYRIAVCEQCSKRCCTPPVFHYVRAASMAARIQVSHESCLRPE